MNIVNQIIAFLVFVGVLGIPVAAYLDIIWQNVGTMRAFLIICSFEYLMFCMGYIAGYRLGHIQNQVVWEKIKVLIKQNAHTGK